LTSSKSPMNIFTFNKKYDNDKNNSN
jgi:hypothetical protein